MNHSLLKENAKKALSDNKYWLALLAEFISLTIIGAISGTISGITQYSSQFLSIALGISFKSSSDSIAVVIISIIFFLMVFVISIAADIAMATFVMGPIRAGLSRFYLENRKGDTRLDYIFSSISHNYKNAYMVSFHKYVQVCLWSLVFIIPGIIKSYEYAMVPYVLAENPEMPYKQVLDISSRMINGKKGDYFCFQLGFIGWYLLGIIACMFGIYFVVPYYDAACTEYYECLKANALAEGRITAESLNC